MFRPEGGAFLEGTVLREQGFFVASGVVLKRREVPRGDMQLLLFLKGFGPAWVDAPGAGRGGFRFGGGTEPCVFSRYALYQGPRRTHLREAEIREWFAPLRADPRKLRRALEWSALLGASLLPIHPDDDVLRVFYWSLDLLAGGMRGEMAEWRFLWRWLRTWGLAPSLETCFSCGTPLAAGVWRGEGIVCPACGYGERIEAAVLRDFRFGAMGERSAVGKWEPETPGDVWERANEKLRHLLAMHSR